MHEGTGAKIVPGAASATTPPVPAARSPDSGTLEGAGVYGGENMDFVAWRVKPKTRIIA